MTQVTITGWSPGLNKVELNHLLRRHVVYSLGAAKRAVDDLLAGRSLTYEFADAEAAPEFIRSVSAVGAVGSPTVEAQIEAKIHINVDAG